MRITIAISSLDGGGAERVAANMANFWAARGNDVTLLTFFQGSRADAYDVDARIDRRDLALHGRPLVGRTPLPQGLSDSVRRLLDDDMARIAPIRGGLIASEPEVVLSLIDVSNIRVIAAAWDLGVPLFVWEQIDARDDIGKWAAARRELYPRATGVAQLTEDDLRRLGSGSTFRGVVIPNPVIAATRRARPAESRTIVACGRLVPMKAFDDLLRIFAVVAARHPSWRLEIIGEGPERRKLEALVSDLRLDGSVDLPGFTRDPGAVFARSAIVAMTSTMEGFPNALCEAMAHGLPAVAFDCSPGMRAIIRENIDGALVEPGKYSRFADELSRLIDDTDERQRRGLRATEVAQRFSIDSVAAQWDILFAAASGVLQ